MRNTKSLLIVFFVCLILFIIPNISNAAVEYTKKIYASDGSTKYNFTGLTLDKSHEYEFGFTKTSAEEITKWYLITEYTETTAIINITGENSEFEDVILDVDTGYITIRDKTDESNKIVLNHHPIDLSLSYLNITNYNVINNGKDLTKEKIKINFWSSFNSKAYYQYEKITDEQVITKFKEIKSNNGDYNDLQSLLKTSTPSSNWKVWSWWNSHTGYPETSVNLQNEGLYYLWIYLAGNNVRDLYGYILVDNLEPEIALDSISLPKTKEVELGKTLILTPTFSPETTTNKIVTWSSSDESVATVDNAGKITPKKIGSTIITVISKDGSKKANCTVTVIASSSDSSDDKTNNNTNTDSNNKTSTSTKTDKTSSSSKSDKKDTTTVTGQIPYTGASYTIIFTIAIILIGGIIAKVKYNDLKGIK